MSVATKAKAAAISEDEIKVGRVFSAKRPKTVGIFEPLLNDRSVLYINRLAQVVQYDSPTVGFGRKYPKVSIAAFIRWAGEDVTDRMPDGEWRTG